MLGIARTLLGPVPRAANAHLFATDDEIITYASAAVAADPDDGEAHLTLYYVYLRNGQVDLAAEHLARAARSMPEVAEWLE